MDLQTATPEQLAVHWHERVDAGIRQTVEAAWRCGQALRDVKQNAEHGRFFAVARNRWDQGADCSKIHADCRCVSKCAVNGAFARRY